PRLVIVTVADPAAVDFAALRRDLATINGASLDDHRVWTERLASMARTTVIIGLGVFGLVLTATVLSVIFATRGAMAGNRDVIEVLHLVGAEDSFIAGEFQRHFMLLGLKGGVAGGGGAMLLFALGNWLSGEAIGTPGAAQVNALFGGFSVGPAGYFGALAVIFLIAVLTAATSRFTVQRHLADLS
ncbi:MAG: ABC transporter permease, partial [Hyphomicrobiales bacterium]